MILTTLIIGVIIGMVISGGAATTRGGYQPRKVKGGDHRTPPTGGSAVRKP